MSILEIKILGAGCTTCLGVCDVFEEVANELNANATVVKVLDPEEIAKYGIISLPAILIDDKVKSAGKVPKREDIVKLIKDEM